MKKSIFIVVVLLATFVQVQAQERIVDTDLLVTPSFFVVVITGVLLAFGFQFLLTTLSVLAGVASIDNVKETYVENKYRIGGEEDDDDDGMLSDVGMGVKLTSAFGFWNMVTIGISLFVATFCALQLTPIEVTAVNFTLSLVIWATFFMLMFYLEGRMLNSMIGSLINTVMAGLKGTGSAISTAFTPSPQSQVESVVDKTIRSVRQEFDTTFDTDSINDSITNFLDKMDNRMPSYEQLKKDIGEVISDNTSNGGSSNSPAKWTAIQAMVQTAIDNSEKAPSKAGVKNKTNQKGQQLKNLLKDLQTAYKSGNSTSDSLQKVAAKVSSLDEEEAGRYIQNVKNMLSKATPEDFDSKRMQRQLQNILNHPEQLKGSIQQKMKELDKDTIVSMLANNTALDKAQINFYVKQVEDSLNTVTSTLGFSQNGSGESWKKSIENKIADFINSTDDYRLDYNLLKRDFQKAMDNPAESFAIIKRRLNTYDRDTLISVLTNNNRISRADINGIADSVESSKNEVLQKVARMEDAAKAKLANLERRAVIQAEGARKTAISAATWLALTIIVSGITAILGGLLELGEHGIVWF